MKKGLKSLHYSSFILFFACIFFGSIALEAKDKKYPATEIPLELRTHSEAVLRIDEQVFTVISEGKAKYYRKYAYTLLSDKAEDFNTLEVYEHVDISKVNYIKATLYDQFGNELQRLKKSDIKDLSAVSGGTIYSDSRVKVASLSHSQYPYTVEFEFEEIYDGLLFYPRWYPQERAFVGVENASMKVLIPEGLSLRHQAYNLKEQVNVSKEGSLTIYEWKINNLFPYKEEPYRAEPLYPVVLLAPGKFSVAKYAGDMSTWQSIGEWQAQLNASTNDLPESTKQSIRELTKNTSSDLEKIKQVYAYLQSKTRYVSVQLGIGGWQPFKASFVDAKGFGDCKALSNYTKNLLDAIGIESYYTLIKAGKGIEDIYTDFPSRQFNHVILCVPLAQDTVWLECTSQTEAFGYMGDFTGDRHALLITPEGGKLVRTPAYGKEENVLLRNATISLDIQGDAQAEITTEYCALQENYLPFVLEYNLDEQKKWLYRNINIANFSINNFSFQRHKDRIPTTTEKLSLTIRKCATLSGKRIFLIPNLMNRLKTAPVEVENRLSDIKLRMAYQDIDSLEYILPEEYALEFLPEDIKIRSEFGTYQVQYKLEGNKLHCVRKLTMKKGIFPKEKYPILIDFKKQIIKADKSKIVFVKGT